MATFAYKARDPAGQVVSSTMEAESATQVRSRLRERNFIVTSISEKKKGFELKDVMAQFQKVKQKSLAVFSRQFSTMVSAGLSLVRALDVLEQQADDKKLKEVLGDIRRRVEGGSALSEAFEAHPTVFSDLYIHLTRAGEVGGVLDETLDRVAQFLEKDQALRAKIKSAMTYPLAILTFAVVVVFVLVIFVIPTFMMIFDGLGIEVPLMTKMLIGLSVGLRKYPHFILIGIFGIVFVFRSYIKTPKGKMNFHKMMFKLPVFGMLIKKITISRFTRTLGTLLSSGVPVMQAMEVTGKASGNKVVEKAVDNVRESLREGESISAPMERSGIFPPMVTQMIAVGEETGSLDSMLTKISDFYDMEIEATLDSLTSLLEPLLLIFIGGIIGFIVIAMFMPMITIVNSIG